MSQLVANITFKNKDYRKFKILPAVSFEASYGVEHTCGPSLERRRECAFFKEVCKEAFDICRYGFYFEELK